MDWNNLPTGGDRSESLSPDEIWEREATAHQNRRQPPQAEPAAFSPPPVLPPDPAAPARESDSDATPPEAPVPHRSDAALHSAFASPAPPLARVDPAAGDASGGRGQHPSLAETFRNPAGRTGEHNAVEYAPPTAQSPPSPHRQPRPLARPSPGNFRPMSEVATPRRPSRRSALAQPARTPLPEPHGRGISPAKATVLVLALLAIFGAGGLYLILSGLFTIPAGVIAEREPAGAPPPPPLPAEVPSATPEAGDPFAPLDTAPNPDPLPAWPDDDPPEPADAAPLIVTEAAPDDAPAGGAPPALEDGAPGAGGGDPAPADPAPSLPGQAAAAQDAEGVATAFLSARTVEEMLPLIHQPERLEQLMRGYYGGGDTGGPVAHAPLIESSSGSIPGSDLKNYVFAIRSPDGAFDEFPISVQETGEGFKVDWEVFVQCKDRLFDRFVENQPATPGEFYVVLERAHYFGDDVANADEMVCLRVSSPLPDGDPQFAFAEKERFQRSDFGQEIRWGVTYFPVAKLSWKPQENGAPYLHIDRIVRESWSAR